MRKYNPQDVVATEKLYLKLRPWIENHPNLPVMHDVSELSCPACGSTDLDRRGFAFTNVGKYPRFRCNHCGKWTRGRYTENTIDTRRATLA